VTSIRAQEEFGRRDLARKAKLTAALVWPEACRHCKRNRGDLDKATFAEHPWVSHP